MSPSDSVYSRITMMKVSNSVNLNEADSQLLAKIIEIGIDIASAPAQREWKEKKTSPEGQNRTFAPRDSNQELRAPRWAQRSQQNSRFTHNNRALHDGPTSDGQRKQFTPRSQANGRISPQNTKFDRNEESTKTGWPKREETLFVPKRAQNAWKPRDKATAEDPVAAKAKELRGLLNKITPTTFEALAKKFLEEEIFKNEAVLPVVVDIIFDKAVEEPGFCPLYSDLCARQVQRERESAASNCFRCSVLSRCQKTFEGKAAHEEALAVLQKEIDAEGDAKSRLMLEEKLQESKAKERRRVMGNVGLIVQLFRHRILNLRILNLCLATLLKAGDEGAVECAIKMIADVGKHWEAQRQLEVKKLTKGALTQAQDHLNLPGYVSFLQQKAGSFSSRLRFAIVDLVELQRNKWEPRASQKQNGPKKMEEVRAEARREQLQNEIDREAFIKQKKNASRTGICGRRR